MLKIISNKIEFDASKLLREEWKVAINDAQKKYEINFDLENDSSVGKIKTIDVPSRAPHRRDKDIYLVQLQYAGGDWELPIYYFRIQIKEGHPTNKTFVFIPSIKQGNGNLLGGDNESSFKYVAKHNDSGYNDERDEKKAWDAVKSHLGKCSKKELKM